MDDLHGFFMHVPAWLCLPIVGIAYLVVKIGLDTWAVHNPMLKVLAQNDQLFGGVVALLILTAGGAAAVNRWNRQEVLQFLEGERPPLHLLLLLLHSGYVLSRILRDIAVPSCLGEGHTKNLHSDVGTTRTQSRYE